jgi:hypothetical protein
MKNQVIKCLTPEHGKKILDYWKSKGVDTSDKNGTSCESDNHPWIYYGVISGRFENYSYNDVKFSNAEIIELPEDEFDMTTTEGRLAYAKKHYPIGTKYLGLKLNGDIESGISKVLCTPKDNQYGNIDAGPHWIYLYNENKWAEIVEEKQEEKVMETQKLSRQGLKEIHSIACSAWKSTLEEWGNTNPLEDYIELTQSQVTTIFLACTKEQLPIVSKYLKQDDGSVDVTTVTGGGFRDENDSPLIGKRLNGTYGNKAFWLHYGYNWEIKHDGYNICLIPTKKK